MSVLEVLKMVVGLATIATGALAIARPQSISRFTGLVAPGPRGISEIRAWMGALLVGLGAAVVILRDPAAYRTLGIAYLTVAVTRSATMAADRTMTASMLAITAAEAVFGTVLVL